MQSTAALAPAAQPSKPMSSDQFTTPSSDTVASLPPQNVTALDPAAQNFDLMYDQVKALKEGKPVQKPIYNHVSGLLDPPEEIKAPNVRTSLGLCIAVGPSTPREACLASISHAHGRSPAGGDRGAQ